MSRLHDLHFRVCGLSEMKQKSVLRLNYKYRFAYPYSGDVHDVATPTWRGMAIIDADRIGADCDR